MAQHPRAFLVSSGGVRQDRSRISQGHRQSKSDGADDVGLQKAVGNMCRLIDAVAAGAATRAFHGPAFDSMGERMKSSGAW